MSEDGDESTLESLVTADRPESLASVVGTDHVTLVGSNAEDTIAFYRDTLGMSLVLVQPNLDRPEVTHLFFETGDGRLLTFFVSEDRDSRDDPQQPDVGAVHHVAFRLEPDELAATRDRLREEGYDVSEFDRGAFHSLYTRDHNGFVIELAADKYRIPDDRRGAVLARAHHHRLEAGDEFVADEHLEAALEGLDLPVERYDLPDAPVGTGDLDDGDGNRVSDD